MVGAAELWARKTNQTYKGQMVALGGDFNSAQLKRFSTGILNLDLALGGGWPFSRVALIAGEYSSGKSLIATKACVNVQEYDHKTKIHKSLLPEGAPFTAGRALYVDVEGSLDKDWAEANGFDSEYHHVARPESSEQAQDIIKDAIRQDIFSLIILDSIEAMTPTTEIEESSEDWQMGLAARLNNKAFRGWNASLAKMAQLKREGPLLLCVNQFRLKIGKAAMFGDPRTLPGGKGQEFCSCIIIYTNSPKYEDKGEKELSEVILSGNIKKNKTWIARQNYDFKLALKSIKDSPKGQVNNARQMLLAGKKYKLIVKKEGQWAFGETRFRSDEEIMNRLKSSEKLSHLLWRSILKAALT